MATAIHHVARALIYGQREDSATPGAGKASLRREIMVQQPGVFGLGFPPADMIDKTIARIMAAGIEDMPPDTSDVILLLDTIAFRHGYTSRADAWRHIGITPNRGRDLQARNAHSLDWPIWFTLRHAALGK